MTILETLLRRKLTNNRRKNSSCRCARLVFSSGIRGPSLRSIQGTSMTRLQQQIEAVRTRQQRQWMWKCLSVGMLISGGLACLLGLVRLFTQGAFDWRWIAAVGVAGPLVGIIYAWIKSRSLRSAAAAIDKACNLKDRTETALQFQLTSDSTEEFSPSSTAVGRCRGAC